MNKVKAFINSINDVSLGKKLVLSYILIIFIPICIFSFWTYKQFENTAITDIIKKNNYLLEIEKLNIKANISLLESMVQRVLGDKEFMNYIRDKNESTTEELVNFNAETITSMLRLQYYNPKLSNVCVYTNNPYVKEIWPLIYNEKRIQDKPWFKKVIETTGRNNWILSNNDQNVENQVSNNQGDDKVALYLSFNYPSKIHLGTIAINMNLKDFFAKVYGPQDLETQTLMIDNTNKVFINSNNNFLTNQSENVDIIKLEFLKHKKQKSTSFTVKIDNKPMVVIFNYIDTINCYIVNVVSLESTTLNIVRTRNSIIIVTIILLVILSIVTYLINSLILKKLHIIIQSMKKIEQGDFNIVMEVRSKDEVGQLAHHFRKMIRKINDLISEAVIKRASTKEVELRALQTQIDSHFLYNVLENIKMVAEIDEQYYVSESITSLGEMMRYNMKWKTEYVTLNEEITHIKNYIALMNLRWNQSITLIIEMDDRFMEQEVLKMSLQPIVENSIKHGFAEFCDSDIKQVIIKAYEGNSSLIIEIKDNGTGIKENELLELNNKIQSNYDKSIIEEKIKERSNGIGLRNVNERIRLFYGFQCGVKIYSIKDNYTKVIIRLPLMRISKGEINDAHNYDS